MPISSLIVRMPEERRDIVLSSAKAIGGVTVTDSAKEHLVVLTETEDDRTSKEIWQSLLEIDGVSAVDLVFHNFEDLEEGLS